MRLRGVAAALALTAGGAACGREPSPPPPVARTLPSAATTASAPGSLATASPADPADVKRLAAGVDRAQAACSSVTWCEERTTWVDAAAGHESAVVAILERAGDSPAADDARALAAIALLKAAERAAIPDDAALRVLAWAAANKPSHVAGLDVVLARVVVRIDLERLGRIDALRALVARWPGTAFQSTLVEELRVPAPASSDRVQVLAELVAKGEPHVQRSALEGLSRAQGSLLVEVCAALASGLGASSPAVAFHAALRVAATPCAPAERTRALDAIEARERAGPLPGVPEPNHGVLSYLCPFELPSADQARPVSVLHAIAKSARQPLSVRREAMSAVRTCVHGEWPTLRAELERDPDPAVREAVKGVDRILIDW
jgi:hypothetical protein